MSIDSLTNDLIKTLDCFDRLGMNVEAKDYWTDIYTKERIRNNTLLVHCLDPNACDVANSRLQQYYNSIRDYRGVENGASRDNADTYKK